MEASSYNAENLYNLHIPSEPKRVFVTQLRDNDDDEDDDVKKIPIVKEKAGKLVELGFNTLQKTLLLKRQHDISKVDIEFQEKKHEFKIRMQKCKEKQKEIDEKRKALNEKIEKFRVYAEENDAKRQRAISKFQIEERLKNRKKEELEVLKDESRNLLQRLQRLKLKISKYEVFEKFLCMVVDSLPEDYLETTDNTLKALIMRYQTLLEMNHSLIQKREELAKQLHECQQMLQDTPIEQSQELLLHNKELADSRTHLENLHQKKSRLEIVNANKKQKYLSSSETLGQIKLAIENLASMCGRKTQRNGNSSLEEQLYHICEYINERESIYNMSCPPPDEKPPDNKNKMKSKQSEKKKVTIVS